MGRVTGVFLYLVFSGCSGALNSDTILKSIEASNFVLDQFVAETGVNHGEVSVKVQCPDQIDSLLKIKILRVEGSTAPAESCDQGALVAEIAPSNELIEVVDATGVVGDFSYRACAIFEKDFFSGNSVSENARSRDAQGPSLSAFSCSGSLSANHGGVICSASPPGDASDLDHVDVRYTLGTSAPNCDTGSLLVRWDAADFTGPKTAGHIPTTANPPPKYSYRACSYDLVGNSETSSTSSSVDPADTLAPPLIVSSAGVTGDGGDCLEFRIRLPGDVSDYYQIKVVRSPSADLGFSASIDN
jgi:hypothetical protein